MKKNSIVKQSPKRAIAGKKRTDHDRYGPGRQNQPGVRASQGRRRLIGAG